MSLAARILALLPQTQCTRCGYPDCARYASAIEAREADINQCPPGGAEGITRLSALTGRAPLPLNPDNGLESPRMLAWIDEDWCIGCTLCINACPVDAIVGSNKLMHTVIEDACTGCELCLPVCPVDCIHLENVSGTATGWDAWSRALAEQARARYEATVARRGLDSDQASLVSDEVEPQGVEHHVPGTAQAAAPAGPSARDSVIQAALARARARRTGGEGH